MTVSRVGGLDLFLPNDKVGSLVPARADIPRMLAGRARALNELVDGVTMVAGEAPCIPPNPQGLLGIDFSGPPWGSAWRHPIAWGGGRTTEETGWQGPDDHSPLRHTAGDPAASLRWRIRNRPHATLPDGYLAPYGSVALLVRARVTSGTATLTVRIIVDDLDPVVNTFSLTTGTGNFQGATEIALPGGGQREHDIVVEIETSAGSAEVGTIALCVSRKRT
jgi:hypothetical protein